MAETHKHHFQVADVGAWDLDQDRSIVPSIHTVLKNSGITAVVDGDEMNSGGDQGLDLFTERCGGKGLKRRWH